MKRQPTDLEEIFANDVTDKGKKKKKKKKQSTNRQKT